MTSEEERRIVLPQYMIVLERKQPAYYESEFVISEGTFGYQRKLLLPLSEDGERVNTTALRTSGGASSRRGQAARATSAPSTDLQSGTATARC
jgi:hypothetical protein